jgi:hypothetical protein
VEHDLLDEIKVSFAHDELLEIIDWTRNETAGKPHACTAVEERGNFSPL